jgi:hypothetical protein
MSHWATIGLIVQLSWASSIGMTALSDNVSKVLLKELQPASDSRLAMCFRQLEQSGHLQKFMALYQSMPCPGFWNLLNRCSHVPPVLYVVDTINEFHHLLVGTLVAYVVSLQNVYSLMEEHTDIKKQQDQVERQHMEEQNHTMKRK